MHHILGAREVIDTVDLFDYDSTNFRAFELGAGANLQGYLGIAAGDGERAHASNWPRRLRIINWERVRRAVVRDELDCAHSIASRIPRTTPRPEGWLPFSEDCEGDAIGMIRLEIADGRAERALGELAQELRATTALGRVRRQLKLHILEALAHHRLGAAFEPLELLTERERQILVLLAGGAANRQIADRIFVSENTVKFHLKNIYSKLGVNNRAQAIRAAHQMHLL